MLWAVDVGNSNIVFGIHQQGWRYRWRMATEPNKTSDEYRILITSLLRETELDGTLPEQTVLSSVVPELTQTLSDTLAGLTGREPLHVTPFLETGITVATDNPAEMGADLLANAAGAYALYGEAVIVVDFGTALTCLAVDGSGTVRGVAISPGVRTAMEALSGQTAQLPHIPLEMPDTVLGTDTVGAIQAGLLHGYVGLVEHLSSEMQREMESDARVIATGGLAERIAPAIPSIDTLEPWLTLEGLRIIAEKNG